MYAVYLLFILYNCIQVLAVPFIIMGIGFLQFKKGILGNIYQRLGFVPRSASYQHVIWIHAVSVGEVLSVQEFITTIKEKIPNVSCYITIGTVAGMRIARKHLTHAHFLSFLPYDFLVPMLIAYTRIKPQALIIVESELWPNLISIARYKNIPSFLLNARINQRSYHRLRAGKLLFKTIFNCFTTIFAQSKEEQQRFSNLGVKSANIKILGNLKAGNVVLKKERLNETYAPKSRDSLTLTLLVGSLHPGEVDVYLELFTKLRAHNHHLKLILAPRHFHWQDELIDKVRQTGSTFFVWTEASVPSQQNPERKQKIKQLIDHNDIILVCTLGELFSLYAYADIFFLGGTFVPIGGHNLLEPAVWGVPTIIGPHYQNCKDIAERLGAIEGIIKVQTPEELQEKAQMLLNTTSLRHKIGKTSQAWVYNEAKAVQKIILLLIDRLKNKATVK